MSDASRKRSPRDAAERVRIETELDRNLMVLAGAGAGKTHELVGRMIALVRTGRVLVDQIAAITFTRKAAGELRDRFVERLREAITGSTGDERARLEEALRQVDQCFMGTIHSFCGRLLRERPLEARIPPDFREIQGEEERRLAREAWDDFVRDLYASEDPRLDALEEVGIGPEDLYDFYCRRNEIPELPLRLADVPAPNLPGAARRVVEFLEEVRACMPSARSNGRDGMMEMIESVLALARHRGIDQSADAAALLERLQKSPRVTQKCWHPDRAYAKRLSASSYPAFYADVVEPALRQWREHLYRPAAELVDDAVSCYTRLRRDRGSLTFMDLLRFAADMLKSHAQVREFFQRRFRVILVDEFQDTDPIQAEVLMYLTGMDVREEDWRALAPRPGSLFLVGDEKQSIYRFRRADVATFRFMRDRIIETDGDVVHLNTSFRSFGNLCGWFNRAFPGPFGARDPRYQAEYGELYDYRPGGTDPTCVRRLSIARVHGNANQRIVELEAPRIARFIRAALDGRTPFNGPGEEALLSERASPEDFLILTRTKAQLSAYAAALEEVGVPYDVTGSKGLSRAVEVRALVELLRVVREPDHPVHYVSLLRGLLFGLSDAELYAYRRAGGHFRVTDDVPETLPLALRRRLVAARHLVEQADDLFRRLTPSAALERLLEVLGLTAAAAARPLGSSRAGNLLRLLSFVRALEADGLHWGTILAELEAVVAQNAHDLEEMALEYGEARAVRIMNVHQAKGLESPVVFLADPFNSRDGSHRPDVHVSRSDRDPHLSVLIQRRAGDFGRKILAQPAGWDADADEEAQYQLAEETRLLYVASTRAQNLLIVSTYGEGTEGGHRYGELYAALAEVPELEETDWTHERPASRQGLDLGKFREGRTRRFEALRAPSYSRGTASGQPPTDGVSLDGAAGRGRDFGSLIHGVFEDAACMRIPHNTRAYLEGQCEAHGFSAGEVPIVARFLDALRQSSLWSEIIDSPEVYTEVPIAARTDDRVVAGKIDLIYRVNGGWKIVDYKTDMDPTERQLPLQFSHYADQVRIYAAQWEAATRERVISAGLYGTRGAGGYIPVL